MENGGKISSTIHNLWKQAEDKPQDDDTTTPSTSSGTGTTRRKRDNRDVYDKKDVHFPSDKSIDTPSIQFINFTKQAIDESNVSFESLSEGMESLTTDDGVKKKLLQEGVTSSDEDAVMNNSSRVWYHFESYGENCTPYTLYSSIKNECASTESLSTCLPGFYVGLMSMKKKEIAEFIVEPSYAYRNGITNFIPPNTRVRIIIQIEEIVIDPVPAIEFQEPWQKVHATLEEVLAGVERLTSAANAKYDKKLYRDASERFDRALTLLLELKPISQEKDDSIEQKKCELSASLALSYIHDENYHYAADVCRNALNYMKFENAYVRSQVMPRYALASFHLGEYEKARRLCEQGQSSTVEKEMFVGLQAKAEYEIALQEDLCGDEYRELLTQETSE